MIVARAEHEIDFIAIRFPIRLLASFDRIHPALRQMASRRSRLDLNTQTERAHLDALRRLPGPSCMSIFSGERTGRFGTVKFDIFTIFDYLKYTTRARYQQCDRLHNANYKNLKSESLIFFIQTVLSESSFPGFARRSNRGTVN
ncbi:MULTISPECIES: hypothetical protein [Burkholderia]|uniref:Uncharacterized protein n=1 Tax=Burkholderia sola TaxID=2843302 RepID=A0ABV2CG28_9BURK|nr:MULTISPECIES: hypothetical protein [Burkholderia]MBP0610064.1 hypothetical protein [Burkholderia sp. CpTa8-5]MBP0717349.1 hypothetical protein [Burkholderia sp. AcTa6-5]QVN15380.1 hypothetical protein JYG37_27180 [Burkholderia sp. LAS2]